MTDLDTIWIEEGDGKGYHLNRGLRDAVVRAIVDVHVVQGGRTLDVAQAEAAASRSLTQSFPPPHLRQKGDDA